VILPSALQGRQIDGQVLEIGAGGGSMTARLLATRPGTPMMVTDVSTPVLQSVRLVRTGDG
jgi:hypothetical protein